MKKLIIVLLLVAFGTSTFAQGFFIPIGVQKWDHLKTQKGLTKAVNPSMWILRPAVSITSFKYVYNEDTKKAEVSNYLASGLGVGYQHYIESDEDPYNNYGINLLLLFNTVPLGTVETPNAGISLAGSFSLLKLIDIGLGYDFSVKQVFVMGGIKYNF